MPRKINGKGSIADSAKAAAQGLELVAPYPKPPGESDGRRRLSDCGAVIVNLTPVWVLIYAATWFCESFLDCFGPLLQAPLRTFGRGSC